MPIVIILLLLIAIAVAPQAILNLCLLVEWLIAVAIRFGIFLLTLGFFLYFLLEKT